MAERTDRPTREITDVKVLAILAHPLRTRLLEILRVTGPATASVLAEKTDQAVGNVSHHLKMLAQADLIVEAPELARDRRERWWRAVPDRLSWSRTAFLDDAAGETVAQAAEALNLQRHFDRARQWLAEDDEGWPHGPFSFDTWITLNDDELVAMHKELIAVIDRWKHRPIPDDGVERGHVFFFAHAGPASP